MKKLPIIMLSCLSDGPDIEKAITIGADWYMKKPINFKILTVNINYLLERKPHSKI